MPYNRDRAVGYAQRWALGRNPAFYDFSDIGGDCTNFASQCIYAGAGIMNYTPLYGWFYISANDRTPSWTGVDELYDFLINNRSIGPRGRQVRLTDIKKGDIVQLKFNEGPGFDHSPVVINPGMGTPDTVLVAAHSRDSLMRPLSSYKYTDIRPIQIYLT